MDRVRALELVDLWRRRAAELETYARGRRAYGDLYGHEGAEDAEQAAADYRADADRLEAEHAR